MYFLPCEELITYTNSCDEKIKSYLAIAKIGLPVLKSIILHEKELEGLKEKDVCEIQTFLQSKSCMIRYLYHNACHHVKNGGRIVFILKENLLKEREEGADLWLLEPCRREDNILCCNVCLCREAENLHMEFLGKGFDISDLNKGVIQPHEQIDIPYPVPYGAYGEWWKWAQFHFCTHETYINSIAVRRDRLKKFGSDCDVTFAASYKAVDIDTIEGLFEWIEKIENNFLGKKPDFYNLSCSFQNNGRKICWDIQTVKGKMHAYL